MNVNFIEDLSPKTGKENMEEDLRLLDTAISNQTRDMTVRFYTWHPKCVSFGKHQKIFPIKPGIDWVIRPTGGRALLHDMELTYSVICPAEPSKSVIASYKEISEALISGFKKIGINLDFAGERGKNLNYCMNISSGADICYRGKKLIGSAQYRKRGYILQHGSILFDADVKLLEEIFGEKIDGEHIITMAKIRPQTTLEELVEALKYGFKTKFEH